MLQLQDLRVDQVKKPCIGLIQENLMKFPSTMYLPYIHLTYSPYYTNLAYSKEICVKHV